MMDQDDSLCFYVEGEKGAEKIFPLLRDGMTIGREPGCDILLPDPSVSKKHALITIENGRTMISDGTDGKKSSNGVYVNETRISAPVTLQEGDVVKMGVFRFDIRYTTAINHEVTLEEVRDNATLTQFLERCPIRKTREDDIIARLEKMLMPDHQTVKAFDEALDRAMDRNELQRVAFISRSKQGLIKLLEEKEAALAAAAEPDPDTTITDTSMDFAHIAKSHGHGASKGRGLLRATLFAALAAALALAGWILTGE
ncbi:MAG: FHA domain-containing protein [Nitrospinae bacterium]|nr:FHA domain-containing protein [Nitrospinota bacterium]